MRSNKPIPTPITSLNKKPSQTRSSSTLKSQKESSPTPSQPYDKTKPMKVADIIGSKSPTRRASPTNDRPNFQHKDTLEFFGDFLMNANDPPGLSRLSISDVFGDERRDGLDGNASEMINKKLLEDVVLLKKELENKNKLNEKLMKENTNLRKEMEEFLATVDDAREYIDIELKESNNRIAELEAEIQELREENKILTKKLEAGGNSPLSSRDRSPGYGGEAEDDKYLENTKKEMEQFYSKMNEQMLVFMDMSKKQYQQFNEKIDSKLHSHKEDKPRISKAIERLDKIDLEKPTSSRVSSPSKELSSRGVGTIKPNGYKSQSNLRGATRSQDMSSGTKHRGGKRSVDATSSYKAGESQTSISNISGMKQSGHPSMSQRDEEGESSSKNMSHSRKKSLRDFTSMRESPKSSVLRAKLKSDLILMEMKKKLAEGTVVG